MEGRRASLDGGGAKAQSLRAIKGLAAPLLQRAIWVATQHEVLPAKHYRPGIPQRVCPAILPFSPPPPRVTRSFVISRFQGDEEDFYKAYGSAIARGHSSLKDVILAARKLHPGKGERRRQLVTNSTTQGGSPMEH